MAETILITGATGLLGKSLVRYFSGKGDTVVAAVRDKAKGRALLGEMPNVCIIEWDVLNKASENISIDRLIHAASETSSACFVTRPVETIVSIVDGTRNVLEFARTVGVRSVVFLSTLEVYGTASDKECLSETDCGALDSMAVRSSYPEAKRLAETLCVAYYREYGVPVRIARLTQTFGTGVVRGDSRVFAQFAEAALTGRDIVLHTPGTTARCYCAVSDAVRALDVILHQGTDGEAYNVANPSTYCTIREMADRIAMRYPGVHVVSDLAAAEGRGYAPEVHICLDVSKLRSLGWSPRIGLDEMFDEMINEWRVGHARTGDEDGTVRQTHGNVVQERIENGC